MKCTRIFKDISSTTQPIWVQKVPKKYSYYNLVHRYEGTFEGRCLNVTPKSFPFNTTFGPKDGCMRNLKLLKKAYNIRPLYTAISKALPMTCEQIKTQLTINVRSETSIYDNVII